MQDKKYRENKLLKILTQVQKFTLKEILRNEA